MNEVFTLLVNILVTIFNSVLYLMQQVNSVIDIFHKFILIEMGFNEIAATLILFIIGVLPVILFVYKRLKF